MDVDAVNGEGDKDKKLQARVCLNASAARDLNQSTS